VELGADGELGAAGGEVGGDGGVADGHGSGGGDPDVAPEAHVLVGRLRVPIDEGDGEVVGLGGEDLDGEGVGFAGLDGGGDVELKEPPGTGEFIGGCDRVAVEPDVGTKIDAVETEPDGLALKTGGDLECGAEPPGLAEGAVGRHGRVGKIERNGVGRAGDGAQIHAGVRVGIDVVLDQRAEDGGGHGGVVPGAGRVGGRGYGVAGFVNVG
jgi:hypothetical protein